MLVVAEIVDRLGAQEIDDLRQKNLDRIPRGRAFRRRHKRRALLAAGERLGDLRGGQHEIDGARGDRALRHAVIVGFADVLRDNEAAVRLDRLEPNGAVGAGPRQDHADRTRAPFARQRIQKEIERQAHAVTLSRSRQPQRRLVVHRQIGAGRNDIDALALDRHAVGRLHDRHRRVAGQQVDHHAVVARIEVLDDDEGHAVIGRQRVEQLPARIEAAGRGADRDDRKIGAAAGGQGPPNPMRPLRLALLRTTSRHSGYFSRRAELQRDAPVIDSTIRELLRRNYGRSLHDDLAPRAQGLSIFRLLCGRQVSVIVSAAPASARRRQET